MNELGWTLLKPTASRSSCQRLGNQGDQRREQQSQLSEAACQVDFKKKQATVKAGFMFSIFISRMLVW